MTKESLIRKKLREYADGLREKDKIGLLSEETYMRLQQKLIEWEAMLNNIVRKEKEAIARSKQNR